MTLADEGAGMVVVSEAVVRGACIFEVDLGVVDAPGRRLAGLRRVEGAAAAVVVGEEGLAGALAADYLAGIAQKTKLLRTDGVDIGRASRRAAVVGVHRCSRKAQVGAVEDGDAHRHVVAVDQAHIVEVLVAGTSGVQGELGQGRRCGSAGAVALELAAAIAGLAAALAGLVEDAARAAPEAASRPAATPSSSATQ